MATARWQSSLRLTGLILALLVVACGGGMESEPGAGSPSSASAPTTSAAPPPTTTAPGPVSGLAESLAGGELLAVRPLSEPNLVYAVKEGRRLTILQRNLSTGDERSILQYDEGHEAKHSGNAWEEQTPSAALSEAGNLLAYIELDSVSTHDLISGASSVLLRKQDGPPFGELTRFRWVSDGGAELCCAFGLANPVIAHDASWLAVAMTQWEGHSIGVFDIDGSAACLVEGATSFNPVWGPQGDLLIPGGGGEYATPGLFVVHRQELCAAVKIAESSAQYHAGFDSAVWSADGSLIATSFGEGEPEVTRASVRLLSPDGAENRTPVEDGFNYWPTLDPTERWIYFVRQSSPLSTDEQSIFRHDLASGSTALIAEVPLGWSVRQPSWTPDGYLVFRVNSNSSGCVYWSCRNRIIVLDPDSGEVIYASGPRDFTNYLGFLP